jgi:hypothetical protein
VLALGLTGEAKSGHTSWARVAAWARTDINVRVAWALDTLRGEIRLLVKARIARYAVAAVCVRTQVVAEVALQARGALVLAESVSILARRACAAVLTAHELLEEALGARLACIAAVGAEARTAAIVAGACLAAGGARSTTKDSGASLLT